MKLDAFINDLYKKAEKHKIKIQLSHSKLVFAKGETAGCGGYFDSEHKILAVATDYPKSKWLSILIHESSHLDQWIEDKFHWEKWTHGHTLFFQWLLEKKIVKREVLLESVQDVIALELDCEKRAIAKIKKYNLPINLEEYCRKANAYLFSHLYLLEVRKWIPRIYSNKNTWMSSPKTLKKEYKNIPRKLYAAFKKNNNIS
jgi:hypothetical protein